MSKRIENNDDEFILEKCFEIAADNSLSRQPSKFIIMSFWWHTHSAWWITSHNFCFSLHFFLNSVNATLNTNVLVCEIIVAFQPHSVTWKSFSQNNITSLNWNSFAFSIRFFFAPMEKSWTKWMLKAAKLFFYVIIQSNLLCYHFYAN